MCGEKSIQEENKKMHRVMLNDETVDKHGLVVQVPNSKSLRKGSGFSRYM